MADSSPPRGCLNFRLRTLMIGVTLLAMACACVGPFLKKVEERRALLRLVVSNGGGYSTFTFGDDELLLGNNEVVLPSNMANMPIGASRLHDLHEDKTPPLIRHWLGDVNVFEIWLPESFPHSDALRIVERFPEAMISQESQEQLRIRAPTH